MINQALLLILCIFAIIGLITILYTVIEAFSHGKQQNISAEIVLYTKNDEDSIEGLVRQTAARLGSGMGNIPADSLTVIDTGSTDETPKILAKLSNDISILNVYTKNEYIKHIEEV